MKEIELTQGYKALVDDEDFERVNSFKWHVHFKSKERKCPYAQHTYSENGKKKTVDMHRVVLNLSGSAQVDHEDRNGLNNQRRNLRAATHSQNQHNKSTPRNNTSGHKGVSWKKDVGKWQVRIMLNSKHMHIGVYTEKQDACDAANAATLKHHGEFCCVR